MGQSRWQQSQKLSRVSGKLRADDKRQMTRAQCRGETALPTGDEFLIALTLLAMQCQGVRETPEVPSNCNPKPFPLTISQHLPPPHFLFSNVCLNLKPDSEIKISSTNFALQIKLVVETFENDKNIGNTLVP